MNFLQQQQGHFPLFGIIAFLSFVSCVFMISHQDLLRLTLIEEHQFLATSVLLGTSLSSSSDVHTIQTTTPTNNNNNNNTRQQQQEQKSPATTTNNKEKMKEIVQAIQDKYSQNEKVRQIVQSISSSSSSNKSHHHDDNHHDDRRQRQRRLEFVHIPKTAGTAVETTAALVNISWGVCHFLNTYKSKIVSKNHTICPDAPETFYKKPKLIHGVPHWHLPPYYFSLLTERYTYNPYENADLFTIVRNPYDRIMSQYYYFFEEMAVEAWNVTEMNNEVRMNRWLGHHLQLLVRGAIPANIMNSRIKNGNTTTSDNKVQQEYLGTKEYYNNLGHLIPQYDYVYNKGVRVIHHVLHFENLSNEFSKLMKEYGLDEKHGLVGLPTRRIRTSSVKKRQRQQQQQQEGMTTMTIANISLDNIRAIEFYYARDFAVFGYETVSQYLENQYEEK